MRYKLNGVNITIDEITSISDVYISTSIYSAIELHEQSRNFYTSYQPINAFGKHIEKYHLLNINQHVIRILVVNTHDRLDIKPIIIQNQLKEAIIYIPGCIVFDKYQDMLYQYSQKLTILGIFIDPSYIFKRVPTFQDDRSLEKLLVKNLPLTQVEVQFPKGIDITRFLNQISRSYKPHELIETESKELFTQKFIYRPQKVISTLKTTVKLLTGSLYTKNQQTFRLLIVPLFDANQPQFLLLNNAIIVRLAVFQLQPQIQLIAAKIQAKSINSSTHYCEDLDINDKIRRLQRINLGNTCSTQQKTTITITDQELNLLLLANML